jgi:hypothetical protein
MTFAGSAEGVWNGLLFYEQVSRRPPLLLRVFLPSPIRTVGRKSKVGDEVRCLYEGGYLVKRVTQIVEQRRYCFEVVEQAIDFGGGIRLSGGSYELRHLPDGCTEVALETRYWSPWRPRWLWTLLEAAICHRFHHHILGEVRRHLVGFPGAELRRGAPATPPPEAGR